MIAVTDKSIVGGIITFILLGLFPLSIFLWIFGTPARRRARIEAERQAEQEAELAAETKSDEIAGDVSEPNQTPADKPEVR